VRKAVVGLEATLEVVRCERSGHVVKQPIDQSIDPSTDETRGPTAVHPLLETARPLLETSLWGCGGFRGAQPVLRLLILAVAARLTSLPIRLALEDGPDVRWLRGVLAELASSRPTVSELLQLMACDAAERNPRFAAEAPAYASFVIKRLRAAARGREAIESAPSSKRQAV